MCHSHAGSLKSVLYLIVIKRSHDTWRAYEHDNCATCDVTCNSECKYCYVLRPFLHRWWPAYYWALWARRSIRHHQFATWIVSFIQKPKYPWSHDFPLANLILSYKASINHKVSQFSRLFTSFWYLWNISLPKGLKYSLLQWRICPRMGSNSQLFYVCKPCKLQISCC